MADEGGDSLLEKMRAANPAGAALLDQHRVKADLAMALRAMRKTKQMSQADLRRALTCRPERPSV